MSKIAILFLLFAVAFAAETKEVELETTIDDYIEIAKCFLAQDYLVKDALDIFLIIKTKEFTRLLPIALQLVTDVPKAIKECAPAALSSYHACELCKGKTSHYCKIFCH